jgi:hypothetical protein
LTSALPPALKRVLWPLIFACLALAAFQLRIRHEMADFDVYWRAGLRALHGDPLYVVEDGHYQFKYLPVFAMAMAPWRALSQEGAKAMWFAVSVGLLAAFVRWSVRGLPDRRWSERSLLWIALILMAKFYSHELLLGQTNIMLGALLVGALLTIQIDQPLVAGILIGLAAFIKPYALILLPWLALTQGLAPSLASLGVLLAGLLLPAARYGWTGNLDQLTAWYRTITASTAPNLLGADNVSLASAWAKWLGPGATATALAAASGAALVGLAGSIWALRRRVTSPEYLEFAYLMLLIPLLSPQGWDYVLLLSTPAVVCLIDRWRETSTPWRLGSAAALVTMCLTTFDMLGRARYGRFMALGIVTICAIVVAASLINLRRQALA